MSHSPRAIYLAVYSNGAKPAHWAIFVPTLADEQKGKVIHVTGNTATGFFLEFKRNYDFRLEDRRYQTLHLADVPGQLIHDAIGDGRPGLDTIARDRLESLAITVPPPGASANPFDSSAPNCQSWIETYVQKLVAESYMPDSSIAVFQQAPKRL